MLSTSIKHPDSEEFIDAKMKQGKVTGANISVKIDNEFMEAVNSDADYIQVFPIDLDITKHTAFMEELYNDKIEYDKLYNLQYNENELYKGCYAKRKNAKNLWKKITYNAWKSAEPGILFWDKVINESIPSCYGNEWKESSTNPCVSKNTKILTKNGYVGITDKLNEQIEVWNGHDFSKVVPTITGYNQKMYKFGFSDGSELECTDYHKFYTWEGYSRDGKVIEKKAKELQIGDKLEKYEFPSLLKHKVLDFDKDYYTLGFFAGDGFIKRNSTTHISLYGEKKNLLKKLNIIGNVSENVENNKLTARVELPHINLNLHDLKKYVPKYQDNYSTSMMSWLAGIIDSDGSRNSEEGSISISSTDRNFLMNIKLHILNVMGVNGSVINEKEGGLKEIKGHEYETNKSYRLIISAYYVKKLYNLGLRTHRVKIDDINPNRDAGRFIKVTSIERIDNADTVYCFKEEKRGRGCFNGVITGQCGELPLNPYDSCRLLAINLYGYVVNPFTKEAYFNWELFKSDVIIAQRYMDDIIELELEKIDGILEKIDSDPEDEFIKMYEINLWKNIRKKAEEGRRTGLGVTAEGDMLAALGLTYGTDKANNFSEDVHETLKLQAYRSSVIMAKERGAFNIYDHKREENNPFILRIKNKDPKLYADMVKYGRRNIALLTIAPTGTASLMTQTTSGIEPVFLPIYKRRRKINPNDKDVRIDYVDDEGISWMEYPVFHHKFEIWLEKEGYDIKVVKTMTIDQIEELVKQSPYYKATSNDVDWVKKVEMQGMVQKHVDHSISVTVNLPNDITEETVAKVYETSWSAGCKGITIYRDGSRSGVLISDDEKKKKEKEKIFTDNHAPKRPKRLKADVVRFQNNLEKWIAVVGVMDGRPYEIFTGRLENGLSKLPPSIEECEVVKNITYIEDEEGNKNRIKRYDIEYIDNNGEKQIHSGLNHTFNSEYWNYAKLISGILRHGMPMEYVYELIRSLDLNDEHLNTWKAGVERVIKRYIKDGSKTKNMKCPVCGSTDLEFKEGCLICLGCGNSACG